jgi:hypothetical protein
MGHLRERRVTDVDQQNMSEIEHLLCAEAAHDLEMECQGTPASIGEMQRQFPEGYKAARELVLGMAVGIPLSMVSIRQAQRISEMIHSGDEGLSSIQEVLNMQPVNALTLTHLIRLERKRTAKNGADIRHNKPGGSKEKREKMRAKWAEGNFDSRDRCAEEECGALDMSFSTARKALKNTPDPPSRY